MRKLAQILMILELTLIASATTPVTVEQLDLIVASINEKQDAEAARQLSDLSLTEQLSSKKLLYLKDKLAGEKAKEALVVLADASVFLHPPLADVLTHAPPTQNEQAKMVSLIYEYLEKTNPKLPDFFASRLTVRYKEIVGQLDFGEQATDGAADVQRIKVVGTNRTTITYRNGHESEDSAATGKDQNSEENGLVTKGTFGSILNVVFFDAMNANSSLTWVRWEQGTAGLLATFQYRVPEDASHYDIGWCCTPNGNQLSLFRKRTAYHGELDIDPANGAIQRLTLEADLDPTLPVARSDIMVEYGAVELGGRAYVCPIKSVSISRGRSIQTFNNQNPATSFKTLGPYVTLLNDVAFDQYHLFRSDVRILTGADPTP